MGVLRYTNGIYLALMIGLTVSLAFHPSVGVGTGVGVLIVHVLWVRHSEARAARRFRRTRCSRCWRFQDPGAGAASVNEDPEALRCPVCGGLSLNVHEPPVKCVCIVCGCALREGESVRCLACQT